MRVSTNEQTLGLAAQRAALKRWCAGRGFQLARVFVENGTSGAASLDKRPGLLGALAALKQFRAGVFLVAKRDRLARDTLVAAMVERLAARNGAVVCSADGMTEGAGPEALLLRRIVDAFAEYERLVIVARTRAAMALKKSRRERVSREPRYGWRLGRDGVHLEVHPQEQRAISLVRRYRRGGLTLRQIGRRLERCGLQPRSGGRWHPQTVARALGGGQVG